MNAKNSQQSLDSWVELLKSSILVSDVNDTVVAALCGHLADLGVLEKMGEEDWGLTTSSDDLSTIEEVVKQRLSDLCKTESGFALRYFLKDPPALNDSQCLDISGMKPKPEE